MMNNIMLDLNDVIVVFIDDVLIFTKQKINDEHDEIVEEVLKCLKDNNLYIKLSKCIFWVLEVEFLGMWISKDGIWMDD